MIFYIESLGCARNSIDSEVMAGRLEVSGHRFSPDPARAEVIVVNTCGFIESAAQEAVDTILELARYKSDGTAKRLVVTGCLAQRYKESDLAALLPEVDAFVGTGGCDDIVQAVEEKPGSVLNIFPPPGMRQFQGYPLPRKPLVPSFTAYLKVSEGCSRKCTYCIIPTLRGTQRSRPADDIAAEAAHLFNAGIKELVLAAENTTDYGRDLQKSPPLAGILESIAQKAENARVRLLYAHPLSLSKDVIDTVLNHPNICSYFDIPIQHASTHILKRMGRGYASGDLYALFNYIREKGPDAALRTTVLTGFPGETRADFDALMTFIHTVKFDHLGVFTYSDAPDLKSHVLGGHVSEKTARERHDAIMKKQSRISARINRKHIGKTYRVLVEEIFDEGVYLGRTGFQAPEVDGLTFIYGSALEIGTFVDVKITEAYEYDIAGETG